jgi:hypothetical protein
MGFGEFGGKGRGSGSAIEGDVAGATSCFRPSAKQTSGFIFIFTVDIAFADSHTIWGTALWDILAARYPPAI